MRLMLKYSRSTQKATIEVRIKLKNVSELVMAELRPTYLYLGLCHIGEDFRIQTSKR
jgi:hypothetical protein